MRKVLSRNSVVNGAGLRVSDVIGSSTEELLLLVVSFLTKRSRIKLMRCYVCLLNFTAVFVVFTQKCVSSQVLGVVRLLVKHCRFSLYTVY